MAQIVEGQPQNSEVMGLDPGQVIFFYLFGSVYALVAIASWALINLTSTKLLGTGL